MKSWGINKTARFPGRIVHAIPTLFHRNSCRPFRKIVHEYFMTLLPVARVFRSPSSASNFSFLPSLSVSLVPRDILRALIDSSKKCKCISIIFPKGSYSTRERGPLSIILRSLCSESYFSCKRKHWRMKVLFPENDRSQTQFTRNRVSRGKLVKVAKLFAFYFRGSISFPGNNNRWNATRCNNTISLPFLLFVLSLVAKRHFFLAEFIRVANHVNRNKERGQEVRGKNPLELP